MKFWLIFAFLLSANLPVVFAQISAAKESEIKAEFLYNFAVLTDWPTNAFTSKKQPLIIGILGSDPFGRVLEKTLKDKTVRDRKIKIARYRGMNAIRNCHMLFISSSKKDHLEAIVAALGQRPILTVSEIDQFIHRGGMIYFGKNNHKIKFSIRQNKARKTGLRLSSKLLALSQKNLPEKKEAK